VGVDRRGDAEALFGEYKSKEQRSESARQLSWAYEMQIEDLDGNVLRMGSEPKPGA